MFNFDFPYASQRMPVLARNVVATSQPLAAQAGIRMLLKGGNAVDAALAAAITLTLVEPNSNGLGSDAFAILHDGKELHGLNASGRSPAAWTAERFAGRTELPERGWESVTVPGAVAAWVDLSERFGALPFEALFEPAVDYAERGFPVSPIVSGRWAAAEPLLKDQPGFAEAFLPRGRAPKAGEIFRSPEMARSLRLIAETRGEAFYRGELAEAMAAFARQHGAALSVDDLAAHENTWSGTISQRYQGIEAHEIPPNGQGIAALMALGILQHTELSELHPDSPDALHLQIEAMKLAFADVYRHVADIDAMTVSTREMLDPGYLQERAALIDRTRAGDPDCGLPGPGGTVYITAADAEGRMVSFIQSNYMGFGSGVVVPGTGISLQNRGADFSLDARSPNVVAPRKRPFHTIIPGFVMKDGQPLMSYGVMGGPMQAQGHMQMIVRLYDFNQNPQAASDAPRWRVTGGRTVAMETAFPAAVLDDLRQRDHEITLESPEAAFGFGGAQLIHRLEEGGYIAGSDHRKDGLAVGF